MSIVSPSSPVVVAPYQELQIIASASDDDGISAVGFRFESADTGALVDYNHDDQAPYVMSYSFNEAGTYRVVARAYDHGGTSSDSAPLLVTVAANQAPVVSLLSPAQGANFDDPGNITITANASDVDGNVASVAFFAGGNLLHTATAAPFTYTWSGVAPGSYTLTAVATDNKGLTSTTAPVTVVVLDNAVESVTYIHTDISGSPLAATKANGSVVWKENYLAYGQRRLVQPGSEKQAQWFHGKEQDVATGLQYFGARYYDPVVGRFMGIDPVGFQEGNPNSFNRYAYGNNNPVKYLDPDGNAADIAIEALSLTIGFNSLQQNIRNGNSGAAVVDGLGLIGDVILTAVPVVPGGIGLGIKLSRESGEHAAKGARALAEPVYKTTKEAKEAAEALGFKKINETVHEGQAVFKRGKDFITRDLDGHNGGAWKMADSVKNLGSKETRAGTFDVNLKRIGD